MQGSLNMIIRFNYKSLLTAVFILFSEGIKGSPAFVEAYRQIDGVFEYGSFHFACGEDKKDAIFPSSREVFKFEKSWFFDPVLYLKDGLSWNELEVESISDGGVQFVHNTTRKDTVDFFKGIPLDAIEIVSGEADENWLLNWIFTKWDGLERVLSNDGFTVELQLSRQIDFFDASLSNLPVTVRGAEDNIIEREFALDWTYLIERIEKENKENKEKIKTLEGMLENAKPTSMRAYAVSSALPRQKNWAWLLAGDPEYQKQQDDGRFPDSRRCTEWVEEKKGWYEVEQQFCDWTDPMEFFFGISQYRGTINEPQKIHKKLPSVIQVSKEIEAIRLRWVDGLLNKFAPRWQSAKFRVDGSAYYWRDDITQEPFHFKSFKKDCRLL